jgi:uncharacterized repeat protein (TIGR01451 family)
VKSARSIFVCVAVIAAGLVAFATPATANQLGYGSFEENTDFASFGVGGMRGSGNGTITVAGVSGAVSKALLYWNGPTDGDTSNADVTFGGTPFTGTDIGRSDDNCWGPLTDSRTYKADVTSSVSGNGAFSLSGFTNGSGAAVNGASLIVFFSDGNQANNRDVTMVEGNDSNVPNGDDSDGWDSTITNVDYVSGAANLQLHVSDGQSFQDGAVDINGTELLAEGNLFQGDSVPPNAVDGLWDIKNYDISPFLSSESPNNLNLTSPLLGDCLSLIVALVDVPTAAAVAAADLSITKTDGNPVAAPGYGPDPVSSGNVVAYKVSVTNGGPDAATGIEVTDTVTGGGTIVEASGTGWNCPGPFTTTTTCTRASLASGTTVEITVQVQAPTTTTGTTINDTATVSGNEDDPTPGNNSDSEPTNVIGSGSADHAAAFCPSTGCTLTTDSGQPGATNADKTVSTLNVPSGVDPQTITLDESNNATLCGGAPCQGQVLEIKSSADPNTFSGVDDATDPVVLTMVFDKTVKQGTKVYIKKGGVITVVKNCTTTGIAAPHPCVSEKNILVAGGDRAFVILLLEGDPIIGKR